MKDSYIEDGNYIANGCGPWWLPDHFKDDYFFDQCAIHDVDYFEGLDRKKADKKFYMLMLSRIAVEPKWKVRIARRQQAWFYYHIVRVFGWMSHKKGLDL